MKTILIFFATILASFSITSCKSETKVAPVQKTDLSEFLGQWTIDIKGGSVGWLEIRQEKDYLDGDLLWGGGSVLPVANIIFSNDRYLIIDMAKSIVRTRDEKNIPVRTQTITSWLEIKKDGDKITGIRLDPRRNGIDVDTTAFTGTLFVPLLGTIQACLFIAGLNFISCLFLVYSLSKERRLIL